MKEENKILSPEIEQIDNVCLVVEPLIVYTWAYMRKEGFTWTQSRNLTEYSEA